MYNAHMNQLNFHHLHLFWTVASVGSIAKACPRLHLTQPTISGQLRELEHALGGKLFQKAGRGLTLTALGVNVFRYADEMFKLGQELWDVVKGRPTDRPTSVRVGVLDAVPKLIARRLLAPALRAGDRPMLRCVEGKLEPLLADLLAHRLDLLLTDTALPTTLQVRAFSHPLGTCGVSVVGSPRLAEVYQAGFPQSLQGAPFLLPTENNVLRGALDAWFLAQGVVPNVRMEFDDSALMKAFGGLGEGLFVVQSAVVREVRRQYGVRPVGRLPHLREHYFALTLERRQQAPAIAAIVAAGPDAFRLRPGQPPTTD